MNKYIKLFVTYLALSSGYFALAQNTQVLDSLIKNNIKILKYDGSNFSGGGWLQIEELVRLKKHTLIGEDHFTDEIPAFFKAIYDVGTFKNFYIEVDPYTTQILEESIINKSPEELSSFNTKYKDLFSFYAKQSEYNLLKYIVKSGTKLLGSDQIVMFSDRVIFDDLKKNTNSSKARAIFENIANNSDTHLKSFLENPENPMFMMTEGFSIQLEKLTNLNLSDYEHQIIKALKISKEIYLSQDHYNRVRLIMNQVMKDYPKWKHDKTLFKYGAKHLTRGESFLNNYDIGNLVANITESNFEETLHIMIVGENGSQGSPFRGFPASQIDPEKGFYLTYLKPFFNLTTGKDWYVFDLRPLRRFLFKKNLKIDDLNLERVIRGYDLLVIIPQVTASKH